MGGIFFFEIPKMTTNQLKTDPVATRLSTSAINLSLLTKEKVFPKLISNRADLSYGEAVFEMNNPTISTASADSLTFDFLKAKGNGITGYEVYVNYSEPYSVRVENSKTIQKTCINENTSKEYDCSYDEVSATYVTRYQEAWKRIDAIPTGLSKIKLVAHYDAQLGTRAIDWIPSVTFEGVKLSNPSWSWWNSTWNRRREINITGGLIDLYNFTVLIDIPWNETMQTDFDDLRFMNGSCDLGKNISLTYELENKTANNHTYAWVKMPVLNTGINPICLYWNNSDATIGEDKRNAWDNLYIGVYHFDEGTGTTVSDSQGLYNMTFAATPVWTGGKIGNGLDFELDDGDKLTNSTPSQDTSDDTFSLNMWLTIETVAGNRMAIAKWSATQYPFNFLHRSDSKKFQFSILLDSEANLATDVTGTWIFGGGAYNGSFCTLMINTSQTSSACTQGSMNNNVALVIGGKASAGESWDGMLDEVKLSSVDRGYYWMLRDYENTNRSKFAIGGVEGIDVTPPSVVFNMQVPADVDSTNCIATPLNITYNITDSGTLNESRIFIHYKKNSTTRNTIVFINGTNDVEWGADNQSFKTGDMFTFLLNDNEIYPATYNVDDDVTDIEPHSLNQLTSSSHYVAIGLLNVTNTTTYNFLEIMSNSTAVQNLYYCNSSFTINTNPSTASYCGVISSIPAGQNYNHTHTAYSKHQVVPFVINATTGKTLAGVQITADSWFILRGNSAAGSQVNYYSVTNTSRLGATKTTSTSGNAWANQTYTVDSHLHQFSGNSSIYYYVCANDTANNENCSTTRSDLFNLSGLPPTSPYVYSPNSSSSYNGNININYTASVSPNGYSIVFYNISLLNTDFSFNKTINTNNSVNLSLRWNSASVLDDSYIISVKATDNQSQTAIGYSEIFAIDNIQPTTTITSCNYKKFGYYNVNLPWFREENCL